MAIDSVIYHVYFYKIAFMSTSLPKLSVCIKITLKSIKT